MIAGLTYTEMRRLTPGFILDMYAQRQGHDMVLYRLKKKKHGGEW